MNIQNDYLGCEYLYAIYKPFDAIKVKLSKFKVLNVGEYELEINKPIFLSSTYSTSIISFGDIGTTKKLRSGTISLFVDYNEAVNYGKELIQESIMDLTRLLSTVDFNIEEEEVC